ncbi:hypothetical protein [Marinoscillum sp. MHG1-6]|uniref:hypothetical protein n=1 Tax=Marinoscillum sp. MHG1-6 TaxID=2959627 RepID=UPI0021572C82|nr:hypothetical protein [Marinoscillum sp. MHG1-6]
MNNFTSTDSVYRLFVQNNLNHRSLSYRDINIINTQPKSSVKLFFQSLYASGSWRFLKTATSIKIFSNFLPSGRGTILSIGVFQLKDTILFRESFID